MRAKLGILVYVVSLFLSHGLFAGIPTMGRHGLILLAVLMLGCGMLAYRRSAWVH